MSLLNKDKVLGGVEKAVDAVNDAADRTQSYVKEKELDKKFVQMGNAFGRELKKAGEGLEEAVWKLRH